MDNSDNIEPTFFERLDRCAQPLAKCAIASIREENPEITKRLNDAECLKIWTDQIVDNYLRNTWGWSEERVKLRHK